jgi:hypothetical protein
VIGMSASRSSSLSSEVAKDPTPVPASAVGAVERAPASSRRGAERNASLLAYFATPSQEMREMDAAWEEALTLYGEEDGAAWVSALEDGTHPLCGVRTPKRSA